MQILIDVLVSLAVTLWHLVVMRENSQTQYRSYELELQAVRAKMKAIITRVTSIPDFIDGNPPPPPVGDLDENPLPPDPFVERCRASWAKFKVYVQSMACTAIGHALSVVRSLYPAVDLMIIDAGFPEDINDEEADQLMEAAKESAIKPVDDLDIFGDKQQNQNN